MTTERRDALPAPTFQPLSADDPREVGGYRVFARLGAGGMGRVYLSYTPGGRPVALKVVRPELAEDTEFRERFGQEVASARRIHGLYTAQVVDAGVDAATPWLATTYVPGPSLQQVVHACGPLPERTVLLLMAGIAEALQAIHAADVVHRDLKPANVLIAADGPRVIDFGIARAADAAALTGTGLRIGSPGFMAPEQALGRPTGPATDVFALGALAVYVAGGAPPFGTGPESTTLYRVVHEEPDLTRVPAALHGLLRDCLAKDPAHRPTTARVIEAARHAVGGQLRFAEDWLPQQVSTEILRRTDLPTAPPPPPTVLDAAPALADLRTVRVPRQAPAEEPIPRRRRRAARGRRGTRTALVAAAALLVGAGGALVLLDQAGSGDQAAADSADQSGSPSPTSVPTDGTPSAPPGYTTVYTGTELTSPDHTYEFDIKAGTVAPQDTATWYLGRSATEFYVSEDSDAFIAPQDSPLTPADCIKGIDSQPVTALPFSTLRPGRTFCVRARTGRDIGIVRVIAMSTDDGPVKVSMDLYRQDS